MCNDCVITVVCNLSFYGKVIVRYVEENDEKITLKFILNKNKSVIGNIISLNGSDIRSLEFNTINEMVEHLKKIEDRIYLVEVA